ncbi:hypothetical protein ACFWPQ_20660 [Streptomyces sp. NPDC058464]|uniref:hypothetical protein n=1 Tax=Streptomyces sp. NPDC058464 TaxID=3346511 RepID=UPI0036551AAA
MSRRADGPPPAVELATTHVRLLSAPEIEARLDRTSHLLGMPRGTVKSRTHLALRALLTALAERGYTH